MKNIQSFWTGNKNSLTDSYGWLLPIFNYLSWIISCNQLRRYYDDPTVMDIAFYEYTSRKNIEGTPFLIKLYNNL